MRYSTLKLDLQSLAPSKLIQALFRSFLIIQPSFSVPISVAGHDKGNHSSHEENASICRNNGVERNKPKAKGCEDLKLVFSNIAHEFRSAVLVVLYNVARR